MSVGQGAGMSSRQAVPSITGAQYLSKGPPRGQSASVRQVARAHSATT